MAEGSRAGWVCAAARGPGAPGRDASSPGPAPALGSAAPPPAARGPRSQPHPPAAASPQPSALRPHPRPHLSCGCSGESGDGGGQTRASSPRSASRPPPSYSHTPPPRGRELPGKGAAREHPRQARAERREAGRPTPAQPTTLREAPGSPSAPWTRTRHALRARAHRAHLPAVCRMRPGGGGVGAARLVRSRVLLRGRRGWGVVARCLEEPSPSSPTSDSPAGQRQQRPRWAGRFKNVKFCWPTGPLPVRPRLLGAPPLVCVLLGSSRGQLILSPLWS